MPRNEEGEFELILGNKQLLTVFFIIVVLLGIFATMGYIVGRSTVPSPPVAASSNKTEAPATAPLVVDPLPRALRGAPARCGAAAPARRPLAHLGASHPGRELRRQRPVRKVGRARRNASPGSSGRPTLLRPGDAGYIRPAIVGSCPGPWPARPVSRVVA